MYLVQTITPFFIALIDLLARSLRRCFNTRLVASCSNQAYVNAWKDMCDPYKIAANLLNIACIIQILTFYKSYYI